MSTLTCISPIDGDIVATRDTLSLDCAKSKIAQLRSAQTHWAARPMQERIDLVMAGVAAVGAMNDEIVPELANMMGRPIRYGGEFGGFNERASHMAAIAHTALAPIQVGEDAIFKRYIKRIPHGVVLVVAPWNYPYLTAVNSVIPALAAGNSVVLKPAEQTSLTALRIAELVENHTEFGDESLYTATFVLAMNPDSYAAMPEDLRPQIPLTREATRAFNLACLELENYEADDIIATLARQAREAARGAARGAGPALAVHDLRRAGRVPGPLPARARGDRHQRHRDADHRWPGR